MSSKSRWMRAMVVSLALLPTAVFVRSAIAQEEDGNEADDGTPDETPAARLSKKRKAVLAKIASDETVLINVTGADMPASPDILNLGRRSTKALARCVADNVADNLRRTCANLLGRIGDKAALPALHGALEAWDSRVRMSAIDALRQIPDASSFEPLKKLYERPEELPDERMAVLRAMGTLGDTRAMKFLRDVATKKPSEGASDLRVEAFQGMWRSRHLMARTTLVSDVKAALSSDVPGLPAVATYYAAELRAPELVPALEPLMKSADMHIRNRAVYALGRIGDKAATKALLAQVPKVREARMLNNIAFALERLEPTAFFTTIAALVEHKQAAIRMNAAFVLGDVRRPESLPYLTKALADKNDLVRASAVDAIGKLDAPEGAKALEPLVDDANLWMREQAIYALDALAPAGRADLIYGKLYSSDKPGIRDAAARRLARTGDLRVVDWAILCFENHGCPVDSVDKFARDPKAPTIAGRLLLQWAKGRSELTDLMGELKPTGIAPVALADLHSAVAHDDFRRVALDVDLLGDLHDTSSAASLRKLLTHENARLRLRAATALARLDQTEADAAALREVDEAAQDRLPGAVRILSRVTEKSARDRLLPALLTREKSSDPNVALAAAAVRLAWDPEAAIFRFLDALASTSTLERDLAERYLRRDHRAIVTSLLRRMYARETRESTRDRLRRLLDARGRDGQG